VGVRVKYSGKSVDLIALVNTGYETDVPEILIPVDIAEKLGLWPKLPDNTLVETYKTASGLMKVYRVEGANISLLADDVEVRSTETYIVYIDEALVSD
jgi:hypothetical protein